MSNPQPASSQKLHHVQIEGFSLGSGLLLMMAIGLVAMQVMGLADGINPHKSLLVQLIPGAIGVVLLTGVLLRGRRRGEVSIYRDRIEGRRVNGLPISINMDLIHTVELKANAIALKDQAGGLLLVQRLPAKADGGLIWFLVNYRGWDGGIWEKFPEAHTDPEYPATRHFLAADASSSFGDIGFLVYLAGETWYFPSSPTVDIQGLGAGQMRMNQRPRGENETQLQFQPQPDWLPLNEICQAIQATSLGIGEKRDYLNELAENHGGCTLTQPQEDGMYEGECLGFQVRVFVPAE